jgi:hypothetical protein
MAVSIFSMGTPSATRCAASFIIGASTRLTAGVEADAVPYDDDVLALTLAEVGAGCGDPVGRLIGDDDLEQGHFVDRREVVHPDHGFRVPARGGDLRDRQRGRIRRENHIFSPHFLHVTDHFPLEREVLEHSLDDDVSVLKPCVRRRSRGLQHERVGLLLGETLALHAAVDDPSDVAESRHHSVRVS